MVHFFPLALFTNLLSATFVYAGPTPAASIRRQINESDIFPLANAQIDAYTSYTYYASATYCQPDAIATWSCGPNCDANPGFEVTAAGGNSATVQFWYVGYDPTLDTVIVAHEGTNVSQILAELTDADFILTPLGSAFPGLPADILVHNGFLGAQQRAAVDVLPAVEKTLAAHPSTKSVTFIGHSLGAAIATLDAAYIPLHLTNADSYTFSAIVYGLPRVGNLAWAAWLSEAYSSVSTSVFTTSGGGGDVIEHTTNSITHINNKEDPIPILPPILLGYRHPIGEVHITDANLWEVCPGMDNPSSLCSTGDVSLLHSNETYHDGPYNGVHMGCPDTDSP